MLAILLTSCSLAGAVAPEAGVAVCLTGGARTLGLPIVHKSIADHLLDPLGADLFAVVGVSEHDSTLGVIAQLEQLGATDFLVPTEEDALDECVLTEPLQSSPKASMWGPKLVEQCMGLVREHEARRGMRYKWVLKARPDMVWVAPIAPPILFSADRVHPADHTDQLFLVPRHFADASFGMFNAICRGPDHPFSPRRADGSLLDMEGVFRQHLQQEGIPVVQYDFSAIVRRESLGAFRARYYCEVYKGVRRFGAGPDACMAWLYDSDEWRADKHFVYPDTHFTPTGQLSRLIHQTARRDVQEGDLKAWSDSWITQNPGWERRFYDDESALKFVQQKAPEYANAYQSMPSPVIKADFFRYLVLLKEGGIYSDVDTECLVPLESYLSANQGALLVGLEADFATRQEAEDRTYARQRQLLQWTMLVREPGHPVLKAVCDTIASYAEDETLFAQFVERYGPNRAVLEYSGPGLWTDVIFSFMDRAGLADWHGDAALISILPQRAWGSLHQQFGPGVYVAHKFKGSWKAGRVRESSSSMVNSSMCFGYITGADSYLPNQTAAPIPCGSEYGDTWGPPEYQNNSCCSAEGRMAVVTGQVGGFVPAPPGASANCTAYSNALSAVLCDPLQGAFVADHVLHVCQHSCDAVFDACGLPGVNFPADATYTDGTSLCLELWGGFGTTPCGSQSEGFPCQASLRIAVNQSRCLAVIQPSETAVDPCEEDSPTATTLAAETTLVVQTTQAATTAIPDPSASPTTLAAETTLVVQTTQAATTAIPDPAASPAPIVVDPTASPAPVGVAPSPVPSWVAAPIAVGAVGMVGALVFFLKRPKAGFTQLEDDIEDPAEIDFRKMD